MTRQSFDHMTWQANLDLLEARANLAAREAARLLAGSFEAAKPLESIDDTGEDDEPSFGPGPILAAAIAAAQEYAEIDQQYQQLLNTPPNRGA